MTPLHQRTDKAERADTIETAWLSSTSNRQKERRERETTTTETEGVPDLQEYSYGFEYIKGGGAMGSGVPVYISI